MKEPRYHRQTRRWSEGARMNRIRSFSATEGQRESTSEPISWGSLSTPKQDVGFSTPFFL